MQDPFKKIQQQLGPPKWFFSNELHEKEWPAFLARPGLRRSIFGATTLLTILLDYGTGPTIRFPAAYALPILIAAWYEGFWPGVLTGGSMIAARLGMERYLWTVVPWGLADSLVNALSAYALIILLVWFTALAGRLSREVQLLGGLLPVCVTCHRFHDDHGEWREFEEYIMERSQAMVRHTLCPKCEKSTRSKEHVRESVSPPSRS